MSSSRPSFWQRQRARLARMNQPAMKIPGLYRGLWNGKSLPRLYMESKLRTAIARDIVLDLGGGESSNAQKMLTRPGAIVLTTDVRAAARPQFVSNCEASLPLCNESVDTVLLFNVIEHIYDHQTLIGEIGRVLRRGGTLYLFVPFLYHRHTAQHPTFFVDDYFRYGPTTLKRLLLEHGQFGGPIEIEACGFGPFTASTNLIATALPWRWPRPLLHWVAVICDRLLFMLIGDPSASPSQSEWSIAYWVKAVK